MHTYGRTRRPAVVPIAIAVVAIVAVLAVVIAAGTASDDGSVEQVRVVDVGGAPLAELTGGEDGAVGQRAPTLAGASFDGEPVSMGAGLRSPQLIFFVAHWCPHCREEVPLLVEWLEQGAPEGIELRAVSTSVNPSAPNYPPSDWLEAEAWPVPTLVDDADASAARAFGLSGFPFFVALDANGVVVARASGELPIDQVEELVEAARGATSTR